MLIDEAEVGIAVLVEVTHAGTHAVGGEGALCQHSGVVGAVEHHPLAAEAHHDVVSAILVEIGTEQVQTLHIELIKGIWASYSFYLFYLSTF